MNATQIGMALASTYIGHHSICEITWKDRRLHGPIFYVKSSEVLPRELKDEITKAAEPFSVHYVHLQAGAIKK